MNFLEFYPSIFILHFVAFGFFLPEEINPLPVGMKTGYVVHALISLHALSSTVTAMASVDGFLTFFFTGFMEIIVWLSIIVFGVTAKSLRLFEGLGTWLQDDDTQTALSSLGEALEGMNDTVDYSTDDVTRFQEPNQTTDPIEDTGQTDLSADEDISRFKSMSDRTRNKVNQMWEKAFRRK